MKSAENDHSSHLDVGMKKHFKEAHDSAMDSLKVELSALAKDIGKHWQLETHKLNDEQNLLLDKIKQVNEELLNQSDQVQEASAAYGDSLTKSTATINKQTASWKKQLADMKSLLGKMQNIQVSAAMEDTVTAAVESLKEIIESSKSTLLSKLTEMPTSVEEIEGLAKELASIKDLQIRLNEQLPKELLETLGSLIEKLETFQNSTISEMRNNLKEEVATLELKITDELDSLKETMPNLVADCSKDFISDSKRIKKQQLYILVLLACGLTLSCLSLLQAFHVIGW